MSLQTSVLHYCNDNNPKVWMVTIIHNNKEKSLGQCEVCHDVLKNSRTIRIILEAPIQ